jgi:nucleolar protein 56
VSCPRHALDLGLPGLAFPFPAAADLWASRDITESFENAISITEGTVPDTLKNFLELNLPKSGKNAKVTLGIAEKILAGSIRNLFPHLDFETADTNNAVQEVLRGIRAHQDSLIDNVNTGDIEKAGLSLGHLYSRSAVKYNAARNDRSVMNCLLSLETQDKSLNSYLMRLKEWYGWYFPELRNICDDNLAYANLIVLISEKRELGETDIERIAELVDHDIEKATAIVEAARISMGLDLPDRDLFMIKKFAEIVCRFNKVRNTFSSSLEETMKAVAPNLQVLVGTIIGARLIEKAGSLVKLAKEPASTLQILGAEKALFRALKTKSNTPKYGILFHSSFVGRAVSKDKGRIARYLANKCVVAARIDAFSENPGTQYGEALRQQVEDRLEFYATGKKTATNAEVMVRILLPFHEIDTH